MADSDKPAREEEFYYLLTEGSEHLQAGRVDDARMHFERALEMNPSHEQALNLLGLSLFRLNQLDRARQIFGELVFNNPIEPSLRLNLAMVHLKTGKLDDAKIELERVLELSPDHPRATSYMGLVLERKGDLDRAAIYYEKAGNKKRADEIRAYRPTQTGTFPMPNLQAMVQQAQQQEALKPAPPITTAPAATPDPKHAAIPPSPPPTTSSSTSGFNASGSQAPRPISSIVAKSSVDGTAPSTSGASAQQTEAAALTAATAAQLKKVTEPPSSTAVDAARGSSLGFTLEVDERKQPSQTPTLTPATASIAPTVASMAPVSAPVSTVNGSIAPAPVTVLPTPTGEASAALVDSNLAELIAGAVTADAPMLRDDGILAFPVPDVGYVRTDMLVALAGQFEVEPVNRRYRGKRTDSLFGGPDAAIVALLGKGLALLLPKDLSVRLLTLKSEELYLVESALLAFTQGLVWENGRLPSESDRDLDIVHLRGSGRLVVGTESPLLALTVKPESPVTVHASRLVGWNGQLVPYRAPLPGLPESARRIPVVRFEGTGVVLAV
jgi:uncharacterized protein (AIM24 family)